MDFEFSPEQRAFVEEVERFLDEHDDPEIFDLTRENMAQIVDTPKRRAFMREMGDRGWLGMTWPKQYGGSEGEGIYEYLLNEALAFRGGPPIVRAAKREEARHQRREPRSIGTVDRIPWLRRR